MSRTVPWTIGLVVNPLTRADHEKVAQSFAASLADSAGFSAYSAEVSPGLPYAYEGSEGRLCRKLEIHGRLSGAMYFSFRRRGSVLALDFLVIDPSAPNLAALYANALQHALVQLHYAEHAKLLEVRQKSDENLTNRLREFSFIPDGEFYHFRRENLCRR